MCIIGFTKTTLPRGACTFNRCIRTTTTPSAVTFYELEHITTPIDPCIEQTRIEGRLDVATLEQHLHRPSGGSSSGAQS